MYGLLFPRERHLSKYLKYQVTAKMRKLLLLWRVFLQTEYNYGFISRNYGKEVEIS